MQEVLNTINDKKYGVGLLLDMTKAYDKVQHQILLNKLYAIGIRGNSHKWVNSYLKNRRQIVEVESSDINTKEVKKVYSEFKTVNASIPQGSVIGCLLFIIYINELPKFIQEKCVLFADDLSILMTCENDDNIQQNIKKLLDEINNWMKNHNLDINYNKTKIITFHPHQKAPLNIDITYNSINLETVTNFTLLGLDIDTHVDWKAHTQRIRNKLARFTYALSEIKRTTDLQAALSTYYAYAYSWLTYGIIMWGNSTNVSTLFTQQKKLIRILVNIKPTDSCRPHFNRLKILTIPCIYILEVCKFVKTHPTFFKTREDIPTKYSLRHKNRLMIPTSNLTSHSNSPFVMSIKIFNKLP
ncbi:reverse transcriptase (RNA-dependent DNA polymerase) domain-containing protein [Phthorimaea operculella]|nr:reverse transcriptase (RNA-dependent DNA polymerase) domain-containing protein [Phthorimaea operculella]